MADTPILDAIREILKFKKTTTIAEVASLTGISKMKVLKTLNRNGDMVSRYIQTGQIVKVDTHTKLRKQEWNSGRYYRIGTYGMWCEEGKCIEFTGHDDLRESLTKSVMVGALGDSGTQEIVPHTKENIAAVEADGMRPWSECVIDDRLWQESGDAP